MTIYVIQLICLLVAQVGCDCEVGNDEVLVEACETELLPGQFLCLEPEIDPDTQQLLNCNRDGKGKEPCYALPGIVCESSCNSTFWRETNCTWTNGYSFETALALSVFFGMFGADRFYLGYPALGLVKFSTLGFFFIGHLVDVLLIATQTVGPADNSSYVISYFGPVLRKLSIDEGTYRKEQFDWF